jgi:hypothetical protein
MKKPYCAPSLAVYGSLGEITLGFLGNAPDLPIFANPCVTTQIGTVIVTCGSVPAPS